MALSKIKSTSLETDATNYVKLADISGSNVSSVELNIDYTGYKFFHIVIRTFYGSSTSLGLNFIRVKRDGQSTFDSGSTDYGSEASLMDGDNQHRNNNDNANAIYPRFATSASDRRTEWNFEIFNSQQTDERTSFMGFYGEHSSESDTVSSTHVWGGHRTSKNKVTDIEFKNSVGNITVDGILYGVKE
jgi:hypothetical protein